MMSTSIAKLIHPSMMLASLRWLMGARRVLPQVSAAPRPLLVLSTMPRRLSDRVVPRRVDLAGTPLKAQVARSMGEPHARVRELRSSARRRPR
jgi:hypothetical protein